MKQTLPFFHNQNIFWTKRIFLLIALFCFGNNILAQDLTNGGTIGYDQSICQGGSPTIVNVTLPSGGDPTLPIEYLWMYSNSGGVPGGSSYTPIPNSNTPDFSPGQVYITTFYVRCARRAGSPNFVVESNPVKITVLIPPTIIINGNPGVGFKGLTVNLSATYAGPTASYTWDVNGDGITDAFGQNITFTYNALGTFDIHLTVYDGTCDVHTFSPIQINCAYEANIFDACDCSNPLNIVDNIGMAYYNNDFIFITSNPGETWTISNIAPIGGGIVEQSLAPVTVGTVIPEATPGRYVKNIWFDGVLGGWEVTVTNNNGFSMTTGPGNISPCQVCSNSPLPVEMKNFTAKVNGNRVILNWETASEFQNSHFVVERSLDGNRFDPLGVVAGNGTTTVDHHYQFEDDKALSGETYYRLKQVDFNGDFEYSEVVSVVIEGEFNISVTPNPVEESAIVRFDDYLTKDSKLNITTLHGEIIQTYEIPETIKAIEIFVGDLPEGIYFLNVESATQRQNSFYKIVKF